MIRACNLQKFYALSKDIVPSQQASASQHSKMNFTELVEFVYRVAEYVYDKRNYEGERTAPPKPIQELFEMSMDVKFEETLRRLVAAYQE